jgi:1A family penicillin-binding protein
MIYCGVDMKIIKSFLFLLILLLIKIGDFVILFFSRLFTTLKALSAPLKLVLLKLPRHNVVKTSKPALLRIGRHKKIKKGDILFKVKHYRRRKISKFIRQNILFLFLGISKTSRNSKKVVKKGAKESADTFSNAGRGFFFFFITALRTFPKPFIAFYRFDKKSREIFIAEQKKIAEEKRKKRFTRRARFMLGIKLFFWGFVFSAIFVFVPLLSLIFLSDLPNPSGLSTSYIPKTTKIYDRNGEILYEIYANQNRSIVKLDEIPASLRQATIAIEDKDFYTHPGFDIKGIIRAIFSNVQKNELQGGSTITQQLIKSGLLTPEPTITRKVKEVILAFWAERVYNKDEILELYFNYVPYGGTAWGIQSASEVYFGKEVKDLDLAQSAFLAGLPRAPSIYSPYSERGNLWKKRQKEVLLAMVKSKYITRKQADEASMQELSFSGSNIPLKAPHFVMYVRDLLIRMYGISEVERGGLQVKTTLDLKTQKTVQGIVSDEVEKNANLNISNGASLVLDPRNGDILAMVGSKNYFDIENDGNVNLTTSLRQPGSTIKIVTYSLALSSGYTQASLLDDSPITITPESGPSYTPVNYDGKFRGRIPLRLSFANSLNVPAVKLAQTLGVDNIIEQGKRLGITTWTDPERYGVSITLGGAETTMVDLAAVYSTIANGGKKVDPNPFLEIKDSFGNTLYKKAPEDSPVIDPGVAFIISDILSDDKARSIEFGTNSPLNIPGRRVSVKTGTTDYKRDNWTIGFTPSLVVATWVGNNDNSPMNQALTSGITGAAPMWNKIMSTLLKDKKDDPILIPENVVAKNCFGTNMYFLIGTENGARCTLPPSPTPSAPATALAN